MRKKSIFILVFMLLISIFSVYAIQINDDFDDDSLDTAIWSNRTNIGAVYLNETLNRLEISGNNTGDCGGGSFVYAQTIESIPANTSGYVSFDVRVIQGFNSANTHAYFVLGQGDTGTAFGGTPPTKCGLILHFGSSGVRALKQYPTAGLLTTLRSIDNTTTRTYRIGFDRDSDTDVITYSLTEDGVFVIDLTQDSACNNVPINFTMAYCSVANDNFTKFYMDNFEMEFTGVENQTGAGCTLDTDCDCGKCQGGFCVLRSEGEECNLDRCCVSGICTNNKCSKTPLWTSLDYWKTEQYGDDPDTNNLLALAITIFVSTVVAVGIAKHGGGALSVVIGALIFIVLSIFFALVSWLNPFMLLGEFLVMLVTIFVMILLRGNN